MRVGFFSKEDGKLFKFIEGHDLSAVQAVCELDESKYDVRDLTDTKYSIFDEKLPTLAEFDALHGEKKPDLTDGIQQLAIMNAFGGQK